MDKKEDFWLQKAITKNNSLTTDIAWVLSFFLVNCRKNPVWKNFFFIFYSIYDIRFYIKYIFESSWSSVIFQWK